MYRSRARRKPSPIPMIREDIRISLFMAYPFLVFFSPMVCIGLGYYLGIIIHLFAFTYPAARASSSVLNQTTLFTDILL